MVAEMITKIGIPSDAELFLRVIVASVLGYMIGYERKNRDKSAGMRTHAIVALGAALMMVVSKYGFYDVEKVDSSRVAAQIVSGVGFLGAGVIFVRNNTVSGLTTAAGLWTHGFFDSGMSPDGKYQVFGKNHNAYIRNLEDSTVVQLTFDGTLEFSYMTGWGDVKEEVPLAPVWFEDSKNFYLFLETVSLSQLPVLHTSGRYSNLPYTNRLSNIMR